MLSVMKHSVMKETAAAENLPITETTQNPRADLLAEILDGEPQQKTVAARSDWRGSDA